MEGGSPFKHEERKKGIKRRSSVRGERGMEGGRGGRDKNPNLSIIKYSLKSQNANDDLWKSLQPISK